MYKSVIMSDKIAVLCASPKSNYFKLTDRYNLEIYTKENDCRNFKFDCPVITHAPCGEWSRLHKFAKHNPAEKELAWLCLDAVLRCGGIFEHPSGSHFFSAAGIPRSKLISVDQHWFNFPGRKRTYLLGQSILWEPLPLNFSAVPCDITKSLWSWQRQITTIEFNEWLIRSVLNSQVK